MDFVSPVRGKRALLEFNILNLHYHSTAVHIFQYNKFPFWNKMSSVPEIIEIRATKAHTFLRKSKLFHHGILNLPITYMLLYGVLGFRLGQLFNKNIGFMINFMILMNYVLVVTTGTVYLIRDKNPDLTSKFYIGFVILMMINFNILIYIYYKKYNFISLLDDVTNARKHSLSKREIVYVILTFLTIIVPSVYMSYSISGYTLWTLKTGSNVYISFKTGGTMLPKTMMIVVIVIYINVTWTLFMATSLVISVLAVVLRREFSKCIGDLQDKIKKTNTLSVEIFTESIERFQLLRVLTQKFDDTFFMVLSLNLGAALGMLCSSIYIGESTFELKKTQVGASLATLAVLLPPSASLHSKVS